MIRQLRRSRLLALLVLLATPGFGGAWLQAVHPCPAAAPWAAQGQSTRHHHAAPGSKQGAPDHQQHGDCHCVGTCHAGGSWALVHPPHLLADAPVLHRTVAPLALGTAAPASRPNRLFPPATAPPTA